MFKGGQKNTLKAALTADNVSLKDMLKANPNPICILKLAHDLDANYQRLHCVRGAVSEAD